MLGHILFKVSDSESVPSVGVNKNVLERYRADAVLFHTIWTNLHRNSEKALPRQTSKGVQLDDDLTSPEGSQTEDDGGLPVHSSDASHSSSNSDSDIDCEPEDQQPTAADTAATTTTTNDVADHSMRGKETMEDIRLANALRGGGRV